MKVIKMNIIKELKKISLILSNEDFIKIHYEFEELWKKYKNDKDTRAESFILKGFVNASASIELYKMNRIEHAQKIWNVFKKYEYLIDESNSINKEEYKKIQELIYIKRDKIQA
jgi:DNA-binding ferritin-like protein